MKKSEGLKHVIVKSAIFIVLFIIYSIIIGTALYNYGLLEDWKIEIYGRLGYIILFSLLGFILVFRERLSQIRAYAYKPVDIAIIFLSICLLLVFYLFEVNAYRFEITPFNIFIVHVLGISVFATLGLGVFGFRFIKTFLKEFYKEMIYFLVFALIVYFLMDFVWGFWPYFSLVVLKIVNFLLGFIGDVRVFGSDILIYEGFAVKIAEACSGIYSIFLFGALYLFALFLDWSKLNKTKVLLLIVPALIGAFLVNVLRVFLLMLIGAHISETIALGLYHSYTGMIFFLVYFGLFWVFLYRWMCK